MIGMGLDGMTTTHGGTVRATTNLSFDEGKPFLRVGDGFWCPRCNVWSTLLWVYPQIVIDGKAAVPQNAKFSCGAELMGNNNHTVMEVFTGYGQPNAMPLNNESFVQENKDEHALKFQIINEETKEPISDCFYLLTTKDGNEIFGMTDDQGYTELIKTEERAESVELQVFDFSEPMEKWS